MIFVVVGTQKFQMNRFLKEIDELVKENIIKEEVFAQTGESDYKPKFYAYRAFLSKEDFENKIRECSLLISHGGVGTIISGLKKDKPVIVYPRLKKYGEHVDDHQLQIANAFEEINLVLVCRDGDKLNELVQKIRTHSFNKYVSQRETMVETIKGFIDNI